MKIKQHILILLIFTALLTASCKHSLTKEEMLNYINKPKNGLLVSDSSFNYKYTTIYKPKDLLFNENTLHEKNVSDSLHYFELQLGTKTNNELMIVARNRSDYQVFANFLNNEIQNYIHIITNKADTLYPVGTMYYPTFGYSKTSKVLVIFESNKLLQSKGFTFNLECIKPLEYQKIQLKYKTRNIRKIPTLIK